MDALQKHFHDEAASFKKAGFASIQWLACGDERTCSTCKAMDKKVLPIEDMRLVIQKHHCENKEDGCRCTFVLPDEESSPIDNAQSKGDKSVPDLNKAPVMDFMSAIEEAKKKVADPKWWREQGCKWGDHAMESFGKLMDPKYSLSNEEAKRIIIEFPAFHSIIMESNIEINDETVPKVIQLIREQLDPQKWANHAPGSLRDAGQEGKT
ncbi:MAG: hypothetical protein NTX71_11505 [Candidatus Aureabacteria bacterium]|nr:hypothetical protein [Candidatus Auribacterota bacterium]